MNCRTPLVSNSFSNTPISTFAYTYDALSRRTQRLDTTDSALTTNTFSYNVRSELIDATMGTNTYSYAYDPIGNRQMASANEVTNLYQANELNQYTNINAGAVEPIYDPDGNLTQLGPWTYSWDGENRLISVSSNGVLVLQNQCDYMSRRIMKSTATQTNTFLYDSWNLIQERVEFDDAVSTNQYVWGLDLSGTLQGAGGVGGLFCWIEGRDASPSHPFFPSYDANGNVTDLVDTNGAVVAHYEYDPYGNTIAQTGDQADANPYRFSSKYWDGETGFYYYGYRFYSPGLGRWLSRDPMEEDGGLNLYLFVENSLVGFWDYLGLWTKDGVLKVLCCKADEWVVDDCLSKRKVFSFDEIKVSYDKYEKLPSGGKGKNLGKYEYTLNGKNDGNIWIRSALGDDEAASTFLHECEHARMTGKSVFEEEIDVRVAEEEFRIRHGMPEKLPGSRKTVSVPGGGTRVIVDRDAIRKWVEGAYAHRDLSSPYIYDNRTEDVTGKAEVSGWTCP